MSVNNCLSYIFYEQILIKHFHYIVWNFKDTLKDAKDDMTEFPPSLPSPPPLIEKN